jgi:hypothetical protein
MFEKLRPGAYAYNIDKRLSVFKSNSMQKDKKFSRNTLLSHRVLESAGTRGAKPCR